MLGTFLLGIAAGFASPHAEPHIRKMLEGVLLDDVPLAPKELSLFSFALCLFGAALISTVIFEEYSIPLALGAVLGVMGPRLWDKWQARKMPDYGSDDEVKGRDAS